jgi:hypothetical protein
MFSRRALDIESSRARPEVERDTMSEMARSELAMTTVREALGEAM